MWNKNELKPVGEAKVSVYNPVTGKGALVKFVIVPDERGLLPLLGNRVSQKMKLITVNSDQFKMIAAVSEPCDPLQLFSSVFNDELGNLPGKVKLRVD